MRRIDWFALVALVMFTPVQAEDWMGLDDEVPVLLGARYTVDGADNDTTDFFLSAPLNDQIILDLEYQRSHLSDGRETFSSDTIFGQLGFQLTETVDLQLAYQFQGQPEELEVTQFQLQLDYQPYPAFASFSYSQGDVTIFTLEELVGIFEIESSYHSDMRVTGFSIGWWFEDFSLSTSYLDYDYERNISALGSSPLLQLLVKPGVLAQSGLFIDKQMVISLDVLLQQRELIGHLISNYSEIDRQRTRALQLDWIEPLSASTNLSVSIYRSDDRSDNWSLTLGLQWNS